MRFSLKISTALALAATLLAPLGATELNVGAPVLEFRYPFFGDDGYKEWMLEGEEAIVRNESMIEVIGMRLTTYTGAPDLMADNIITSPKAILFPKQQKALGQAALHVKGDTFEVRGDSWEWRGGEDKAESTVEVRRNVVVEFAFDAGLALGWAKPGVEGEERTSFDSARTPTTIRSDHLTLVTTETSNTFVWTGIVTVEGEDFRMEANTFTAVSRRGGDVPGADELGEVDELFAVGDVLIEQEGRSASCQRVDFIPAKQTAVLSGNPVVRDSQAIVHAWRIVVDKEKETATAFGGGPEGDPIKGGRTEVRLLDVVLAPEEAAAEDRGAPAETVVRSELFVLGQEDKRRVFDFQGNVTALGGDFVMNSESLVAHGREDSDDADEEPEIERLTASGNVDISHKGRIARCEQAELFPGDELIILTGQPVLTNNFATVTGWRIEWDRLKGVASAIAEPPLPQPVIDGEPSMPATIFWTGNRIGEIDQPFVQGTFDENGKLLPLPTSGGDTNLAEQRVGKGQTLITSERIYMFTYEASTIFNLEGGVYVETDELTMQSQNLRVVVASSATERAFVAGDPGEEPADPLSNLEEGGLVSLEAWGDVLITQGERTATAGRAEFLPREDLVVLSENPVVRDKDAVIPGWKIEMNRTTRRARVIPNPALKGTSEGRSRIQLTGDTFKNLDKGKSESEKEDAR